MSISDGKTNPYATPSDPYCVPVQATDKDGNDITDKAGNAVYEKNKDGTYVCDPNTVPERVLAYRQLNGLGANVKVPVDAVTASASGLDPDISIANADLQAHARRQGPSPRRSPRSWRRSRRTPTAAISGSSARRR